MLFAAQLGTIALALAIIHRPLGHAMALAYTSRRHLRLERWLYRATGVDPDAEQSAGA